MARLSVYTVDAPASDAKSFDKWYFSLSKKEQETLRQAGVLPYREMAPIKHIFAIDPNHRAWSTTDVKELRTETEAFISREHVAIMLKGFMDALSYTNNYAFRRHVELIRWSLSLPGCLSSRAIGKMYDCSHEQVRKMGKRIQTRVDLDAIGLFPHVNSKQHKHTGKKPPCVIPPTP